MRKLETVVGYDVAVRQMVRYTNCFNDLNGAGRMVPISESGLEYRDDEGSGEFYKAVCQNINTAASCAEEVYDIFCAW